MVRWLGRIAMYLVLPVLGAGLGVAGAFLQAAVLRVGPVPLPVGLAMALTASTSLFVGGRALARSRWGAAVPALSWLAAVLLVAATRPEGDVVLSQAATAYAYLFVGALAGAFAVGLAGPGPSGQGPAPRGRPSGLAAGDSAQRRVGSAR